MIGAGMSNLCKDPKVPTVVYCVYKYGISLLHLYAARIHLCFYVIFMFIQCATLEFVYALYSSSVTTTMRIYFPLTFIATISYILTSSNLFSSQVWMFTCVSSVFLALLNNIMNTDDTHSCSENSPSSFFLSKLNSLSP